MIDPTREEWLAARERATLMRAQGPEGTPGGVPVPTHSVVEAALGPCPPEPAPEPFRIGEYTLVRAIGRRAIGIPRHALTPDEADAMAAALVEHAAYAREQEDQCPRSS